MEHILILHFNGEAREKLVNKFVGNLHCTQQQLVGELLQHVAGLHRTVLVRLQVFCLHFLLSLVVFSFKTAVCFFYYRRESVVVHHAQCHHFAEVPIGIVVAALLAAHACVEFWISLHALIEREEHAQVAHAERHIRDATYLLRQFAAHLHDVALRGAEDGNGAVWLLAV